MTNDDPDQPPWIEVRKDIIPYSDYSRLSEQELIMRGIEFDNHYSRFDLDWSSDVPENNQQSDGETA